MKEEQPKPQRLFIGVRVSLATVRALEEAVQGMRPAAGGLAIRWVAPAAYHVTLKFLGWCRPEVVEAVRDRVGRELRGAKAVEIETRGLGAFPGPDKARVLWAGTDSARLRDLVERVEKAAAELGFAREKRAFHAHVTLARLKAPGDVRKAIGSVPEQTYRRSWIDTVVLFESKTKSNGSEYSEIAAWPLELDSNAARRHTRTVEEGRPTKPGWSSPQMDTNDLRGDTEDTGDGDKHEGHERER